MGGEIDHSWDQFECYGKNLLSSSLGLVADCVQAMWAVLYGWTPEIFGTKSMLQLCLVRSAQQLIKYSSRNGLRHCLCAVAHVSFYCGSFAAVTDDLVRTSSGGMIAPLLGGILLTMDRTIPVYTSVVIFAIAGFCVLLLRENAGDSGARDGAKPSRSIVH